MDTIGNNPVKTKPPTETGVLKNTASNIVTLEILLSTTVTVVEFANVEKLQVKFVVKICGVIFDTAPDVMICKPPVAPTARWPRLLRSSQPCRSRGTVTV